MSKGWAFDSRGTMPVMFSVLDLVAQRGMLELYNSNVDIDAVTDNLPEEEEKEERDEVDDT